MGKKYSPEYDPRRDGRRALSLLCPQNYSEYDSVCAKATRLDRHPFGLAPIGSCGWGECDYLVLAYPGHTDASVESMLTVMRHVLRLATIGRLPSLRIIRVPMESRGHDLFFELAFDQRVYLVGGCNDYSGEGGDGGDALQSVFALVSRTLNIPFVDITAGLSGQQQVRELVSAL